MSESSINELKTSRTLLRAWRDEDLEPFARLNADPEVMRWFPSVLTRDTSDALATRIRARLAEDGWGLWALEVPGVSKFCGFVGLNKVPFEASFTPAVEIGWRLAPAHWGHGYATEAAAAALQHGFAGGLHEIVAFTATGNRRSQAVMTHIGMVRDPAADFDHPGLAVGDPLRPHVLYRTRAGMTTGA